MKGAAPGARLFALLAAAAAAGCAGPPPEGGAAGAPEGEAPGGVEGGAAAAATAGEAGRAEAEIRDLFAEYLRLHAAGDLAAWQALFLPQAIAVETAADGSVNVYPVAELAAGIAEEARSLASQHETLEEARLEVRGHAASYSARYTLFQDSREVQRGRAFFLLARDAGRWRITSLSWFVE